MHLVVSADGDVDVNVLLVSILSSRFDHFHGRVSGDAAEFFYHKACFPQGSQDGVSDADLLDAFVIDSHDRLHVQALQQSGDLLGNTFAIDDTGAL